MLTIQNLNADQLAVYNALPTEALKATYLATIQPKATGSIRVGTKGGVSLYGFGRRPVTLYQSQWEYLFSRVDDVKAFIKANESKLAKKPVTEDAVKAA